MMADSDSDESPSQPVRAPPASFSLASIREIERGLGNVSRATDYPMTRGQPLARERPRASTNPGGRAAIPRVAEPARGRPRAASAAAPPPVASFSQLSRSQYLPVPRSQGRHRPSPPPAGPSIPRQQARSSSRPYQPAMTTIREAQPAPRRSPLPPALSAADGAPGPSRSLGAGASAPTVVQSQGGYLAPPPLQEHNWDPPNRRAASGAVDSRIWRTGRSGRPLGPPLASRPRPPSAITNTGMAYPAPVANQESERFNPHAYQEETEQAIGRLNLGPSLGPEERERGRGRERPREREDRSTFARGYSPSQGSLSGASQSYNEPPIRTSARAATTSQIPQPIRNTNTTWATSQNQQPIRSATTMSATPQNPQRAGTTTTVPTSSISPEELDTPMSASALPGWDTGYYSVEQAAVFLANDNRRTTIYIDSGMVLPTQSSSTNNGNGDGEQSEDDFS